MPQNKKSQPDDKAIIDLDKLGLNKVVLASDLLTFSAKQAAETSKLINSVVGTSLNEQLIETGRIASSIGKLQFSGVNAAFASLAKAQVALMPTPNSLVFPALESLRIAQNSQLKQAAESMAKMSVAWKPIFDLRIITGGFAAELLEQQAKAMANLRFDIGSMVKPLQVFEGLTVGFQDTLTKVVSTSTISVKTTNVRTFDNELVAQRQETKIDMLLTSTKEQTGIIATVEKRLSGIETIVLELAKQGKQIFSIKDFAYDNDTCELTIKNINKRVQIRARRERQLCELLLRNAAAMVKQWSVDDLLEVIGEDFTFAGFDTQQWTDKFYKAALRLNTKLNPLLGFDLIKVDRKQETFYINPQFYHN